MPRKIALLIGVSEYGEGIPPLKSPPNDVVAIQRVLQNPKMGGFDEVTPLVNPDPVSMQQEIQRVFRTAGKEDLILLFFSGHGITDDENSLYLATRVTAKDNFEATAVSASFIQKLSKNSYAKRQIIILDCCYSGAFAEGWQAKSVGLDLKKELGAEGRVVLTSSTATQTSFEQEGAELSLYTQYLIEGIETGAADTNSDGKIYAQELHEYAKAKVQEVKPKMLPGIILDKEGYNIFLSLAPINDPELEFRQVVEKYAYHDKISEYAREVVKQKQKKHGISDERAEEIINSVLEPFRRRLANLSRYEEAFRRQVECQYPLDQRIEDELRDWQQIVLGLNDEDVAEIQQKIISEVTKKQRQQEENKQLNLQESINVDSRKNSQEIKASQNDLELNSIDVKQVEQPIIAQAEAKYAEKVNQKGDKGQQQTQLNSTNFALPHEKTQHLQQQEAQTVQKNKSAGVTPLSTTVSPRSPQLPSWKVVSGIGIGLGAATVIIINAQKFFTPLPSPTEVSQESVATSTPQTSTSPKFLLSTQRTSLVGAGASFPTPLYTSWFQTYKQLNPNVQINYQAVGSGAGVEQFIKGTVDFGASDVAMRDEEIAKVSRGVLLLPMTAGMITIAYNLPGVQSLKLPRAVYTDIFLGKIKAWNDPKIAAANPGANLPNLPITVVHRTDGSGTTSVFTQHLSAVSSEWKSKVGAGKSVSWPVGVGAKGNEGVTAQIQQTQGAIGYVEYGYAIQNNLSMAALQNKAGQFIEPTADSGSKTLDVTLPNNLRAFITDPEGADSYPIIVYTWLLAYRKYGDPNKATALKDFINWSLSEGQKFSTDLGYVPLPPKVVDEVKAAVNQIF